MISDYKYKLFADKSQIADIVKRLGNQIETDYKEKRPVLIGVLKGAFIFMADLIRNIDLPIEVDFISVSSYGEGTESCGNICLGSDISIDINGKDVIIIEDIVDTGLTTDFIKKHLERFKPASVKICCLLDKPSRRVVEEVAVSYKGLSVPDKFLVGYGLDYSQKHRNMNDIYYLEFENEG